MKNFRQFRITTEPFNSDLISGLLWNLEITGIQELEDSLLVFVADNSEITLNTITDLFSTLKAHNLIESFKIEERFIKGKNWNKEWEKNLSIIEVTKKLVIKPSFKDYVPKENKVVITIDPKMSFGTGMHETTKLILTLLEKYVPGKQKVLDVGSGTAVLSIAAAKLGAQQVLAIDNDEWCYINGNENVKKNKVSDKIEVLNSEIQNISETEFDLILANINKSVLLTIKEELAHHLINNGLLILSGILIQDKDQMKQSFEKLHFRTLGTKQLNEWIALVLQKQNP